MPDNNDIKLREAIKATLRTFESKSLRDASLALLKILGYHSDKTITVPKSDPNAFLELLAEHNLDVSIDKNKALFNDWKKADVLFQFTDEELKKEGTSLKAGAANTQLLQSYLFFAIELNQQDYARGKLIAIARQLNRVFPMPVMVLIKHGGLLSVAVINRRQNKIDSEKDVLGKATIIRDISLIEPHAGHIQILGSFALQNLTGINNFDALHAAWEEILNVELLNKKFYNELSNWYFWAIDEVSFPGEPTIHSIFKKTGLNDEKKLREAIQEHSAKNVIRLLTRFLFVWFIKEKQLIPGELFDPDYLQKEMLKDLSPYHEHGLFKSVNIQSHYYKAILQNLFFATLNQEMGKRAFRRSGQNMNVTNLLRYENCFKDPGKFIELAEKYTPFMNGGLFECLDKPHATKKGRKGGDVIIYEDGFSDRTDNPLKVPDYLFFGHDEDVDLSDQYGSKAKKYKQAAVKGLINIFNSYKFTIAENTPIDQEIALDPELLGKVFENLLASYNPETKTTARKQTGSFYTPREIVGYMVDESLIAYLKNDVEGWEVGEDELDIKLHELFSYNDSNPFQSNQSLQKKIIRALDHCKILDPACGSGAFPMGILQKMVHILQKVDPENTYWQELQMDNAVKETESVFHIENKEAREQKLIEINEAFDQKVNDPDYARKLFLIENCIYGVDIQPIATQISKLRFFISLVVDQRVDKNKDNFGIRPLPNLETKFVAANTLIGIDNQGGQMTLDNPEIKTLESELIDIRHRIFSAKTPRTKRKLRDEDKEVREKMGKLLIEDGWASKTANQLAGWDPYDQNMSAGFFDSEWMFGAMDGFDVVIGNPPYIQLKWIEDSKLYKNYNTYTKSGDVYTIFYERANELLKNKGIGVFITSNKWIKAEYGKKLRDYLVSNTQPILLIDFGGYQVFNSATVDTNILLWSNDDYVKDTRVACIKEDYSIDMCLRGYAEINKLSIKFKTNTSWILLDKNILKLKSIIENNHSNIKDSNYKLYYGILTGANPVFIIDEKLKNQLTIKDKRNEQIIKPLLRGQDLEKFTYNFSGKYLISSCSKVPKENIKSIRIDRDYPSLMQYFEQFGDKFKNRGEKGEFWYNLRSCNYIKEFDKPKIIYADIVQDEGKFYYDTQGFYTNDTAFIIRGKNLKSLTVILNSLLIDFSYKNFYAGGGLGGSGIRYKKEFIERIPLPILNSDDIVLLDNIHDLFVSSQNKLFQSIVNAIVFELYFSDHMHDKQINVNQFVNNDIEKVMQDKIYETLPDREKEHIINHLHSIWTHPDSEVRNRIKLFAVRSPDVLKPILESR
jgi:hypothetical protein